MTAPSDREQFLRQFHAAHPGATSRALARTGCYARFAARCTAGLPPTARILDLACGDGALLAHLPANALGLDLSLEELRAAGALDIAAERVTTSRVAQGRAQALPFAAASFDVVTCHLAFMLFDELERVVAELARVLVPDGRFIALLGGGPTADGVPAADGSTRAPDAFHRFLALLAPHVVSPPIQPSPRFGDRRASSEAGWRELFAGWSDLTFERWELDASGSFDEVWAFLGASYQLPPSAAPMVRTRLADEYPGPIVPCRIVTWCASVASSLGGGERAASPWAEQRGATSATR